MKKRILLLVSVVLALIAILSIVSCDNRPKYKVTLDLAGGTGIDTEYEVREGDKLEIGTPTREGYEFTNWYVGKGVVVWKLDTDVVTSDISLRAGWKQQREYGICPKTGQPHNYEVLEDTQPTCTTSGKYRERCVDCYDQGASTTRKALGHDIYKETVAPTCGAVGYTYECCKREDCSYEYRYGEKDPTGEHTWSGEALGATDGYRITVEPTKYTHGIEEEWCTICPATRTTPVTPLYTKTEIKNLVIGNYKYTGGKYTDAPFVNISGLAGTTASSYYTVCIGGNAADGNINSYWSANTLADGANFVGEWLELTFPKAYDIGALNFVMPNYTSWELGDECYVEFDVELKIDNNWVKVGTVSDKNGKAEGMNSAVLLEFSEPKTATALRAIVKHSTRYAPAMIYELEVLASTQSPTREPASLDGASSASVTGKWSEWVKGSGALIDGDPNSYWWTDWRHKTEGKKVYAELVFPKETFIAAAQFSSKVMSGYDGRTFSLQYWKEDPSNPEGGYFVEFGQYTNPAVGGMNKYENMDGVSCQFTKASDEQDKGAQCDVAIFTVDMEITTLKLRLELVREPIYWESKIFSFTPYTVKQIVNTDAEASYGGCLHEVLSETENVVAPTCLEAGYTVMRCGCGYETKSKATDAKGHSWGAYEGVTKSGSATIKTATCADCSATKTMSFNEETPIVSITQYLKNAPAVWSHTFDDGNYIDTYEWAIPIFEKYKMRATVVMAITYSDGFVAEWQKYFSTSNAFDLGSHSYNHGGYYSAGEASEASLLDDVNRAHYWFMHNFKGQRILGFAAPNGATSDSVGDYLAGFYVANRIGDSPVKNYNLPSELTNRVMWGRLNSYVSKNSQSEGEYTYVKKSEIESLLAGATDGDTTLNAFVNYMYNAETNRMQDDDRHDGTYWYNAETYVYEWLSTGSYNMHTETVIEKQKVKEIDPETGKEIEVEKDVEVIKEIYTFVADNSGDYIMVHSELGTYEKGINNILDVGGWSIDCIHTLGVTNQIWSSYNSTVSKLEFLKKARIWGASYTDAIMYLREYQQATVELKEMNDTTIKVSLTDTLDDYMFNHALTVKIDIPDDWTNVTVKQNGVEIPLILDLDEYYDDFAREACTIVDGFLYVDAVPDAGEIVVTVNK